MVSFADHVLPVLAVIAVWFVATGLIAWAANRARETFARSLLIAGVAGAAGLVAVVLSLPMEGANGAMLGLARVGLPDGRCHRPAPRSLP